MKVLVTQSCPTLVTSWTVAHWAPLSMKFSRQEYWSGLPFPSPGDLPDPGIQPGSPALQADSLPSEPPGKPFKGSGTCKWERWLVQPRWPWLQPRHHGTSLPKGKHLALSLAPLHSRPSCLPHSLTTDKLVRCGGISLLIQNTSWLLLLLLSLPLLQAMDFISL